MSADTPALSHITLGTNDSVRAARFYDGVLATLGFSRVPRSPGKPPLYATKDQIPHLYLYEPYDGRPATWGNGTHIAFLAETRTEVDAFYAATMGLGGKDEGPPGIRENYSANYSAAYVRDSIGNKRQAVGYADS